MKLKFLSGSICCFLSVLLALSSSAQVKDTRTREYILPQRIVWKYDGGGKLIENIDALKSATVTGQSVLAGTDGMFVMRSTENEFPSILVDFGKEIQGGLRFVTGLGSNQNPVKLRVRFGESVSEAMSEVGKNGATNDHAMRDFEMYVPWGGYAETSQSGFRFARIDLVEPNTELILKELLGVFTYLDIPYRGSFRCNDERLNRIWQTGAYTVHLNMQEYLWDGIKRDRLVWIGDMHPEVMTINYVFGYNDVVPKSLDLSRDLYPLPGWMNGIGSYSVWWIMIHRDWYMHNGDLAYLKQQQPYLTGLLKLLMSKVDENGKEQFDGNRFLDWPSSENQKGVNAGLQALLLMGLEAGAELCEVLGDEELAGQCEMTADRMKNYIPDHNDSKQAAALMALSGLMDPVKANEEVISVGGARNFSTFYGYYMLQAMAMAGDYQGAMDIIKQYWGAMLDLGATTFWEDFNLDWTENAAGITEIVPEGKKDIHGDFGNYCYENLRHSLCHGWASGPTSWLSEHVLGVKVLEPGCRVIKVEPHLGDLEWVEGSFPTPQGDVVIKHRKVNGKIVTDVKAPKGIKVVK